MRTGTHDLPTQRHQQAGLQAMIGIIVAIVLSLVGASVIANAAVQLNISITSTFSPSNATIQSGTTVTWTNNDSQSHELRSTSGPVEFRSDPLAPGQSSSVTFTTPGTYTYVDHQNDKSAAYRGTLVVTDAAVPVTPSPATTPQPPVTAPPAPPTAAVHLAGAQFSPATVTVAVGGTVTWTNNDASKHTVTADDASFDSGALNSAATFAHTFTAPGTYPYGCDFHGNMRGTVIVTAAGSPAPAPAPVPPAPAPVPPAPQPTPPAPPVASPPPVPGPGATPTNESITISNSSFVPSTITVNVGSTITWSNGDTVTHTVTADDQSFASGLLKKATSWSHTFATAGTFTYFCEIHPNMTGTVIARAADGSAPPAAAPPTNNTAAPANNAPAAAAITGGASSSAASGSGSVAAAGPSTGSIAINDNGFTPASFRLAVGGTLTFSNNGRAAHTVTATDGSFDSDMIRSGGTWAHTFNTAGTFSYHCILHPNMKGTVQVVGLSSSGSGNSSGGASTAAAASESNVASSATDASTTSAASSTGSALQAVGVDVVDNQFNPAAATVAQGGTVTWKLSGEVAHTITADDQSFNSGIVKPGDSFQHTFTEVGTFTYMCMIHPGMTGTINVVTPDQAAAAQPAATAVTPPQQPGSGQTTATAGTSPARDTNLWGNTLVGIAAVLLACCALVFALRSFLKILGVSEADASGTTPAKSDNLTPNPI